MKKQTLLTEVTSSGMEKTIRNEKLQAANTERVTSGCCRCRLPYFQMEIDEINRAEHMANTSK